jgi:4,5-DOPA dioxygenase extradiol
MKRKHFIKSILALSAMGTLGSFKSLTDTLPKQSKKTPVLFTSHGSPMDIPLSKDERPFWNTLSKLGEELQQHHDIKAVLVVSAHWCTKGTFVNIDPIQEQIYDYY